MTVAHIHHHLCMSMLSAVTVRTMWTNEISPARAEEASVRSSTSRCCSTLPDLSRRVRSCSRLLVLKEALGRSEPRAPQRLITSLRRLASAACATASVSCRGCHMCQHTHRICLLQAVDISNHQVFLPNCHACSNCYMCSHIVPAFCRLFSVCYMCYMCSHCCTCSVC